MCSDQFYLIGNKIAHVKTYAGPQMRRSVEELVVEIEERIDARYRTWMDAEIERRVNEIIEKKRSNARKINLLKYS